ncbi:BTAD domain-containing putative transcriptional regulator [Micromonospora sp. WMMD882]|uniref:AfsR/SARP family transcriptional regulator n=1 Tax=Micromonospora sp. WMMD882 TaxID=3015151 RepID=UPI00248AFF30|nr:BTAD domain-containing putative transcriptional regulator [Micromonospora sp. WMMD882]WBB78043.1 BTAD domain-containing putative transcriptional regulator [Micromonospora sp. WMMD882]
MEVIHEDRRLDIPGVRARTILAILAANRDRSVQVEDLIETVWDGHPPSTARSQIQICVSQIRRILAAVGRKEALATRFGGYLLRLSPVELDAGRFELLVTESRHLNADGQTTEAVARLREADALWYGTTLASVPGEQVDAWRRLLDERRGAAVEERIRLELTLGRHDELIGELEALIAAHPLRERLHAHLMIALYRADRQADALQAYRRARALFVDQLGIEPSAELSRLEHAILSHAPHLDPPARPRPAAAGPVASTVPRQLPGDLADFTGRHKLVTEIRDVVTVDDPGPDHRGVAPLAVVTGPGGVGKTSLAVHVAHSLVDRFPDGQLYADLGGLSTTPERPAEVLDRFLRALGVAGAAIPDNLTERMALYRSRLAGRRVLILLDNAADEAQVASLLPNTAGCAVIVTSRARLGTLAGTHEVDVDALTAEQSVALLRQIVGERILAEPVEVEELARLCGWLPLALRIAGARLASRPHWRVSRLVERLRDRSHLLDELVHRDLCIRTTIGLSYHTLPERTRWLLRRLVLLDCADFPLWVTAPLLDERASVLEDLLEQLVDVRLLEAQTDPTSGATRYRMHDLVRVFARERLLAEDPPEVRQTLVGQVLGAWLAVAEEAHRREYGGDFTVVHGSAARWPVPPAVTDELLLRPMDWLELERRNLVCAVRQAGALGFDELCWDLAFTLVTLFETRSYFDEWAETADIALAATRRAGNLRGEGITLHSLGAMHMFLRDPGQAERMLTAALRILGPLNEPHAVALVQRNLAYLCRLRGDDVAALRSYEAALTGLSAAGDRVGRAHVLVSIAGIRLAQGDRSAARALLGEALTICRDAGARRVEAQVLHRLGELYLHAGELDRAESSFQGTLDIVRATSDRTGEAYALHGLGTVYGRSGRLAKARVVLTRSRQLAAQVVERLVEAQAWYELSQLADRDPVEAADQLRRAADIFHDMQARVWHARALRALEDVSG